MNKEIHYKCRCTGQRFTFKEWSNYLKGNPPKVVHTYKEFCFNICDVCLTLERPLCFDPFGQTGFAPVGHNIIAPCKVLVQGSILFYPFRHSGFS